MVIKIIELNSNRKFVPSIVDFKQVFTTTKMWTNLRKLRKYSHIFFWKSEKNLVKKERKKSYIFQVQHISHDQLISSMITRK